MPDETKGLSQNAMRRLKWTGIVAGCVAIVIVISGVATRLYASKNAVEISNLQSVQTVSVLQPALESGASALRLPGKLQAFYSAPIYARVPGYLKVWYKDIGAQVHKGDVLGVIDTPELDQQIEQAKADLANAVAGQKLSLSTADRWTGLLKLDAVSKQESEEKTGDLAAKNALVTAAKANLDRLQDLKSFSRITAPFDGVVTKRSVDIGALINAGAEAQSLALFEVADLHQVRVYVSVPQTYAAEIHPGLTASLTLPEYPGRVFSASLDTTSNSISDQSDTLLVELLANNPDGVLKPGDYARVTFNLPSAQNVLRLPASALMFRQQGLQVATVLPNNRVKMKSIRLGHDFGTEVEVTEGITAKDRVVDDPPDSIETGDLVHVIATNHD